MLLFLYGTLLDPRVLARQSGEPGLGAAAPPGAAGRLRPRGPARHALSDLGARPGAATRGAVLRAGPAARRRLAAYEGPQYRLVPVRVETRRGPVRARAWMAARWRAAVE